MKVAIYVPFPPMVSYHSCTVICFDLLSIYFTKSAPLLIVMYIY